MLACKCSQLDSSSCSLIFAQKLKQQLCSKMLVTNTHQLERRGKRKKERRDEDKEREKERGRRKRGGKTKR